MTRLNVAWANLARENNLLKLVSFSLAATTLTLGMVTLRLALRTPLIIERSCISRALTPSSTEHTQDEVESFLREALSQRFDSDAHLNGDLLALGEMKARDAEQAELARRQIKERVLLNNITRSADSITADTDRVLSVGGLRSAFAFPLVLRLETIHRSISNPYGLVLVEATPKLINPDQKEGGAAHDKTSH